MAERKTPLFDAAHYNVIAKRFREAFPIDLMPQGEKYKVQREKLMLQRATVVNLALEFAKWFKAERDSIEGCYDFDPIKFLDACSPDTELYPLSELWEDE